MTNQQEHKNQVLEATLDLVRVADRHQDLTLAMSKYVQATAHLSISNLERWESTFRSETWLQIRTQPKNLWNFFSQRKERSLIPWLDCCNSNGYQREKAVKALDSGAPNAFLFAIALRRLNDWVPQVRAAAREHIPKMAANTKPEHIVEALWATLPHLNTWGRLQNKEIEVLMRLLFIEKVSSQIKEKIITTNAGPVASIFRQVGRKPVLDNDLPAIAKNAIQPAVRAVAYRSQLKEQMVWIKERKWVWTNQRWCQGKYEAILEERKIHVSQPFSKTLSQAARDKSAIVRRVAGDILIVKLDSVGTEAVAIAQLLANDPNLSIAERGQFALKKLSEFSLL